jgi:hypothetical protein
MVRARVEYGRIWHKSLLLSMANLATTLKAAVEGACELAGRLTRANRSQPQMTRLFGGLVATFAQQKGDPNGTWLHCGYSFLRCVQFTGVCFGSPGFNLPNAHELPGAAYLSVLLLLAEY